MFDHLRDKHDGQQVRHSEARMRLWVLRTETRASHRDRRRSEEPSEQKDRNVTLNLTSQPSLLSGMEIKRQIGKLKTAVENALNEAKRKQHAFETFMDALHAAGFDPRGVVGSGTRLRCA